MTGTRAAVFAAATLVTATLSAGALARTGILSDTQAADGHVRPAATPAEPMVTAPESTLGARPEAAPAIPSRTGSRAATLTRRPMPVAYRFPVVGCTFSYGRTHHDYPAADIFAARGCTFSAPVDGTIDEVQRRDTWDPSSNLGASRGGRAVSLVGTDGVRYYGSHLQEVLPGVRPGLRVRAGQPLGRIGDSGSARGTGTHLHFALSWPTAPGTWWIRRGILAPQPYLDSWRSGGTASPVTAVAAARRGYGNPGVCHVYC